MDVDLFDFDLPQSAIALRPARPRDSARLLHVDHAGPHDRMIADLPAGFANVRGATLDVGKPNVVAQRAVGQFVAQEQVHDTREIRCALIGLDIAEGF